MSASQRLARCLTAFAVVYISAVGIMIHEAPTGCAAQVCSTR